MRPELAQPSKSRKISLPRLEKAVLAKGGAATDEMRYLAGLLRIRHVYLYPESGDIVIEGPAEGWVTDLAGRVVGLRSGRPVVQLQDLAVALRAYPPGAPGVRTNGCSLDPTEAGLADMQRFLNSVPSNFPGGSQQTVAYRILTGLQTSLGMQEISITGVPPDTHFAQVMVEADYRMKLIGIGLEQPPVRMVSFVEKVKPATVSRNALFRWYFVPDYQCVRQSDDGLAMELVGDGVKLIGEDELVTAAGGRKALTRANLASQVFTTGFTRHYPQLAERSPVYAELRNLIDLVVAAAYVQQQDYYGKAGWSMEFLGDESAYSVQTYNAPKQVASTVNAIFKKSRLMTPIGGGVEIRAARALDSENLLPDEAGRVGKLREEIKLDLAEGQWWWD
jgi:hypothetical protein